MEKKICKSSKFNKKINGGSKKLNEPLPEEIRKQLHQGTSKSDCFKER